MKFTSGARRDRPTVSQTRRDIDAGRTGDKVAAEDPAAAPLGTDSEAAGAPPSPEAAHKARRIDMARSRNTAPDAGTGSASRWRARWAVILIAALVAAAFVAAAMTL